MWDGVDTSMQFGRGDIHLYLVAPRLKSTSLTDLVLQATSTVCGTIWDAGCLISNPLTLTLLDGGNGVDPVVSRSVSSSGGLSRLHCLRHGLVAGGA